jgi:MFS transporter, MHS family, proline/betaine transporter
MRDHAHVCGQPGLVQLFRTLPTEIQLTATADRTDTDMAMPTGRQTAFATMSSIFGWSLDLFDLFIILYMAPIVAKLFFPSREPMWSLAGVYASFAVTLLIRPLGAALFGSYADRNGRRTAMKVTVVGVGVCTALFGLLPTVNQIGWSATVLFLALRLVQGIFVGGVVASSHTIGTESVPERWRGLLSGAVGGGGSALGGLLASLVFYLVSMAAPGSAFSQWGWRVMFLSGLLTSIVGLVLFRNLEESVIFQALKANNAHSPLSSPIKIVISGVFLRIFLINLLLTVGAGAGYYLTTGYLPTFLNLVSKTPNVVASLILVATNLAAAIGAMSMGELSQHIGRKKVFLVSGAVRIVAFPLIFLTMGATKSYPSITVCAVLLAFIANGSYGPLLIFLNERFPTAIRASGTGLSWNVGFAIGGMMPTFVSLTAHTAEHIPAILASFSVAFSLVFLAGAFLISETKGALRLGC